METGKKNKFSLTSIDDMRLPVWPVSTRSSGFIGETKTRWGTVRLEGAISARHRDLIDAIALDQIDHKIDAVGRLHVLFDAKDVQKRLGCDNWRWMKEKLKNLTQTLITITKSDGRLSQTMTVLSGFDESDARAARNRNEFQCNLKKIVFSELATKVLLNDVTFNCSAKVGGALLGMRHQVSRSLARWCLSHSTNQNHDLKLILHSIGCIGSRQNMSRFTTQIIGDKTELAKLGIEVESGMCRYTRNKEVWFGRRVEKQGLQQKFLGSATKKIPRLLTGNGGLQRKSPVSATKTPRLLTDNGGGCNENPPS